MEGAVEGAAPAVAGHDAWEDKQGGHAIFGLIGSPVPDSRIPTSHTQDRDATATTGSHDVVATLYEQYCRALDDPHASLAGMWAMPESMPPQERAALARGDGRTLPMDCLAEPPLTHIGSIEILWSGARQLTDAFGILDEADLRLLTDTESVPEVLRLFAPAEYQAAAHRRPLLLPPTLARREHHMPGIDSPIPSPVLTRDDGQFV